MAVELERTCHMRPRQAWRLASELSLDEAADRYNEVKGDPKSCMRGSRIWDYEQWPDRGVRPTVNALRLLAKVYGTTWVELVDLQDLNHMPEEERELYHHTAGSGRRDRVEQAGPAGTPRADHPDPHFTARVTPHEPYAAETPAPKGGIPDRSDLMDLTARSAQKALLLARHLATTNVDHTSLEQLETELLAVSRRCLHSAPYPVFLQLVTLHGHLAELVRDHQRPAQTRTLHVLMAKCLVLMAWVCDELGDPGAARDHAWAAWRSAGHAEDDEAHRWVRVVRSRLAFSAGDFVESAQLANGNPTRVGLDGIESHLLLRRARAWARAGQHSQARAELRNWQGGRNRRFDMAPGSGVIQLEEAQQQYFAGAVLLDIGEVEPALANLYLALNLFEETPADRRSYVEQSLSRIDAAKALLKLGLVDDAEEVVDPVFRLSPERRVQTILSSLDELGCLAAAQSPAIVPPQEQWSARIRTFISRSITRSLRPCA
ncbi:hypothetical protein [Streptomyces sp. NPDC000877]|uniref:hypothetical protein n=1 Tax=unclassified Streptomyces TaxID=2593676 RepID=UPI00332D0436